MDWLEPDRTQAAVACLVACAALGWFVPSVIARIPEPAPEAEPAPDTGPVADGEPAAERRLFDRSLPPAPDKPRYAVIAATPGLSTWMAVWSGLVGAAFG